jgi:hypothetical protein
MADDVVIDITTPPESYDLTEDDQPVLVPDPVSPPQVDGAGAPPEPEDDQPVLAPDPVPPPQGDGAGAPPEPEDGPDVDEETEAVEPVAGPIRPSGLKLGVVLIASEDFFTPGSDLGPAHIERICQDVFHCNDGKSVPKNQPLDFQLRTFCKRGAPHVAGKVLIVLCHSMGNDSEQMLSLSTKSTGALGAISFLKFAETVKNPVLHGSGKRAIKAPDQTYQIMYLGFCQGHNMVGFLNESVQEGGLVIFYGQRGEDNLDGAGSYLVQEFIEWFLEDLKKAIGDGTAAADIGPDLLEKLFKDAYVSVGSIYLGPTPRKLDKEPSGDHTYAEFWLRTTQLRAAQLPGYVEGHTFAGNLNAVIKRNGKFVPLVDAKLVTDRERYMQAKQKEVDDTYAAESGGSGGPADSGVSRAAGKRRRD